MIPLYKQKQFYVAILLTILSVVQIFLFLYIHMIYNPLWKNALEIKNSEFALLETAKEEEYHFSEIKETIADYEKSMNRLNLFSSLRKNTYTFDGGVEGLMDRNNGEEEIKYDFFPWIVADIFPKVESIILKDISVEVFSINEKGDIEMPIFGNSFTALAKQYSLFKSELKTDEGVPLIEGLVINSFRSQKKEMKFKNEKGKYEKRQQIVYSAMIVGNINPELYIDEIVKLPEFLISAQGEEKTENKIIQYSWDFMKSAFEKMMNNMKKEFE
ncbi:hypothetical protein COB57_03460 [Candidatus Peregrinibacteria bacterium]|nr:MAG: hypothetical protein COB57_03460 [Candidatus Peregrinibacteria bacterium]